jgi:D-arabinose 1-dehydrogenase-like Zn-dependent alcohol dehydrogenase
MGSPDEIRQLFVLSHSKNVRPWIKKYSFEHINAALDDFRGQAALPLRAQHDSGGTMD